MFRNILVAVDHSPAAWRALQEATELSEATRARLTIATIVTPMPAYAYGASVAVMSIEEELEQEACKLLRHAVDSVPADVPVTSVLRHGRPAAEILRLVEEGDHDLVVIGSRDRGRTRSSLFGSVATDLHYHARVAVLVVHGETTVRRIGPA